MSEWKKTDDLVKRLREGVRDTGVLIATAAEVNARMHDAAERIEELERELEIRGGVLELHRIRIGELECAERQRDELLAALEKITDPIKAMRDALPEGAQLNGMMAAQLSESPAYLKELARAAIDAAKEQGK